MRNIMKDFTGSGTKLPVLNYADPVKFLRGLWKYVGSAVGEFNVQETIDALSYAGYYDIEFVDTYTEEADGDRLRTSFLNAQARTDEYSVLEVLFREVARVKHVAYFRAKLSTVNLYSKTDRVVHIMFDLTPDAKSRYKGYPATYHLMNNPKFNMSYYSHAEFMSAVHLVGICDNKDLESMIQDAWEKKVAHTRYEGITEEQKNVLKDILYTSFIRNMVNWFMSRTTKTNTNGYELLHMTRINLLRFYQHELNIRLQDDYNKSTSDTYARSFQTKKNIPEKIKRAMDNSPFREFGFTFVEYDESIDLNKIQEVYKEAIKIVPNLPAGEIMPELRFRRLMNHKANGLYYYEVNCICVDLRQISSFIHEYGHYLDYQLTGVDGQQLSLQPEFEDIILTYSENFPEGASKGDKAYYLTPTEIFARAYEVYYAHRYSTSNYLNKSMLELRDNMFIQPLLVEGIEKIESYFDNLFDTYYQRIGDRHMKRSQFELEEEFGKPTVNKDESTSLNGSVETLNSKYSSILQNADFSLVDSKPIESNNDLFLPNGHTAVALSFEVYKTHRLRLIFGVSQDGRLDISWIVSQGLYEMTNVHSFMERYNGFLGVNPAESRNKAFLATIGGSAWENAFSGTYNGLKLLGVSGVESISLIEPLIIDVFKTFVDDMEKGKNHKFDLNAYINLVKNGAL